MQELLPSNLWLIDILSYAGRRRFKRSQRQVENFSIQAKQGVDKYFFGRLPRLSNVRRFVYRMGIINLLARSWSSVSRYAPYRHIIKQYSQQKAVYLQKG